MTVKHFCGGETLTPCKCKCNMACARDEAMAEDPSSSSTADSVLLLPESVTTQPLNPELRERVKQTMLEHLVDTSAHFAHQQRGTPDLSKQDKMDIAAGILDKNPVHFLARFGKFLHSSDLAFFLDVEKDSYEIQFYLNEIRHRCSHSQMIVKNRRYSAMKELEEGGEYFSEDAMKRREPLLYEQMVGQFMTEEEQQQKATDSIDRSDLRFSSILLTHMDEAQERALYKYQKEKEDCQNEEEEDSEEEEDDDNKDDKNNDMEEEEEEEDVPEISDVRASAIHRQQLRDEFIAIMHEKFLSGDDSQFDYSKVDDNPDYDSLVTVAQDEEQKYFLAEEPHTCDLHSSDSPAHYTNCGSSNMSEGDEDDYMTYEPPADLVAKSARFIETGSWREQDECD